MDRHWIAAFFWMVITSWGCESDAERARTSLVAARTHLAADHQAQAIAAFEESTRLDPTLRDAFVELARARASAHAWSRSMEAIDHAIALRDNDAGDHELRAHAAIALQRYDDARQSLERAVTIDPARPRLRTELGSVYERLGDPERARDAYQQALDADPNEIDARIGLARILIARMASQTPTEDDLRAGRELLERARLLSAESDPRREAIQQMRIELEEHAAAH